MPINEPKTPEQIANEIFSSIFGGAAFPKEPSKASTPPTVDNVAEINRLLKKAEEVAKGHENEADILIVIADKHLRLVETALTFQK